MSEKRKLESDEASGSKCRKVQVVSGHPAVPSVSTEEDTVGKASDNADSGEQRFLNDKTQLLKIFPEELWMLIFQKLECTPQLEKVSNASLFFREILSPQKTTFMFLNVWRILENEFKKNTELRFHETIKLRLVCRSWCKVIEDEFQTHPLHFEINPIVISYSDKRLVQRLTMHLTRLTNRFQKFASHFSETHQDIERNPFIARSLHLRLQSGDHEEYNSAVQTILQVHGRHVWHSEISFLEIPNQPIATDTSVYSRMREVLCWMPNLKTLHLTAHQHQDAADQQGLQSAVTSNPLPPLDQLQLIRSVGLAAPILRELVRRINRITTLDIHHTVTDLSPLECVQTLAVTFSSDEHLLIQLPKKSPLAKLYLRCEFGSTLNLERLCQVLEGRFKNTLNFLHFSLLSAAKFDDFREPQIHKVDLPYLTHLELKLEDLILIDKLLPLSGTLTNLNISLNCRGKRLDFLAVWDISEQAARIKFFKWLVREQPLNTNLWVEFSKLELLNFKFSDRDMSFSCSASRREWEEKMKTSQGFLAI